MQIYTNKVVSGTDIYGREVAGKIIGTSLGHVVIKTGDDRLDTTTMKIENIQESEGI